MTKLASITVTDPLRLRERRLAQGLSQAALGGAIGIPQAMVSQAELHIRDYHDRRRRLDELLATLEDGPARLAAAQEEDCQRIARQEALWAALPASPEKAVLQAAMLERCLDLMHEGDGSQCDAIAEWLPPDAVRAMFDRWERETSADRKCACCAPDGLVLA